VATGLGGPSGREDSPQLLAREDRQRAESLEENELSEVEARPFSCKTRLLIL